MPPASGSGPETAGSRARPGRRRSCWAMTSDTRIAHGSRPAPGQVAEVRLAPGEHRPLAAGRHRTRWHRCRVHRRARSAAGGRRSRGGSLGSGATVEDLRRRPSSTTCTPLRDSLSSSSEATVVVPRHRGGSRSGARTCRPRPGPPSSPHRDRHECRRSARCAGPKLGRPPRLGPLVPEQCQPARRPQHPRISSRARWVSNQWKACPAVTAPPPRRRAGGCPPPCRPGRARRAARPRAAGASRRPARRRRRRRRPRRAGGVSLPVPAPRSSTAVPRPTPHLAASSDSADSG